MRACFLILAALSIAYPLAALADEACTKSTAPLRPIMATHSLPPYPDMSVMTQEQGVSLLLVHIGANGVADDVKIAKSSGSARLDEAARDHIKANWRWQPPALDCKPVAISTLVSIAWDLRDAPTDAPKFPVIAAAKSDYPAQALANHEEGSVEIILVVKADGTIANGHIVTGSGFADLDDKALEIARDRTRWTPARMDGAAVLTLIQVIVRWQIDTPAPKPTP